MSSLPHGFEPQTPEDLGPQSLAELQEMLKCQERLLHNKKFICKLPDKGKKVLGSVVKLKAVITEREEARVKSELFHPVSIDCKLRQKAIAVIDVDTDKAQNSDQILDTSSLGLVHPIHKGDEEAPDIEYTVNKCPASSSRTSAPSSSEASERLPQHRVSGQAEDNSSSSDHLFIDRSQRITVADPDEHHSQENTGAENEIGFGSGTQKKPHYMEDSFSHWQRGGSPISSAERRHRDKKHLDDITAARLLLLHHLPSQLLSIEDSLALQKQQKQNYEEMEAKLEAQKLAERLNIKMQSYAPEGETWRKY
ncbi:Dna-Directed Rna polymerase Ii Subunit Grinl1A [Manis pentadactyla]|nr:Dna-Directed Rna polymerase Ii Subunit Grinl1A [Manis pentadactyla]